MSANLTIDVLAQSLHDTLPKLGVSVLDVEPMESDPQPQHADVSAHIPVVNEERLCVLLTADSAAAMQLVKRIAGAEVAFDDDLVGDTLGEILNVVVGAAQREAGHTFGIPVLAKGRDHVVRLLAKARCTGRRCAVEGGHLGLYVFTESAGLDRE